MSSLFDLLRSRFPADLTAPFLILRDGRTLSYGDIDALLARFANVLAASGAQPGDRVAVQVEKSAEAVALYLACLRGGFVYLPLNSAYRDDELEYFFTDAEARVAVGDPTSTQCADVAAKCKIASYFTLGIHGDGTLMEAAHKASTTHQPVVRETDDLAAILYSSGTTGKPKGVMLSNGNLAANALTLHKLWEFKSTDVLLHALPIFHTHGLFVALNTTILNGTPILFHTKFNADDAIADLPRATVMMGVPTFYVRLLNSAKLTKDLCKNMRLFISGSAPLLEETFRSFEERTGHAILERYGMTEAGMITSALPQRPRRANTVGWPLPDVTLRIVNEHGADISGDETGEIHIKGPNVFKGYWRKPEKTAEDFINGFFKTGDLACFEPDGMISIVGRAKDMMISGGFNVYPKEIETIIDGLPGVDESAVVGMPHPDFGEAGLAIITMKAGAAALSSDAVTTALKEALANYKIPKLVVFADTLPRNAMGKVQKKELRQTYATLWERHIKTH
ncbi:MAG: AMP-binding protein [Rhodospirillaceae bacterium]|nr:AMP-binding protein [Rhodospirillaceae bacterium]